MKKNRILALLLALVMLVSLIPMNALAMTVTIVGAVYEKDDAKLGDTPLDWGIMDSQEDDEKVTVSTKDYEDVIMNMVTGELYEIVGLHVLNNKVMEKLDKTSINNSNTSASLTAAPKPEDFKTTEEYEAAYAKWLEENADYVLVTYGPHTHELTDWIADATNHWKNCKQCKQKFLKIDWHHDYDKDDKCDECGNAIVYYDITIPEVEGVKSVTLEGPKDNSTAAYNDEITVTLEAEEGYSIKGFAVYKIREDGSKAQIVHTIVDFYKEYDFIMQNFDCEIVITCEKN